MAHFEILTKCECEQIVERKFHTRDFEILDFKCKPVSTDLLGFLGEHLRLYFHILLRNEPVNFTLFCKRKLTDANTFGQIADDANCYKREIFYLELVTKNINCNTSLSWIPFIYLDRDSALFVVEDMGQHGFTMPKNQTISDIDYEHTKILFKSLAKMHAFSLIFENENCIKLSRKFFIDKEYKEYFTEVLFNENVKGWDWVKQATKVIEDYFSLLPENERAVSLEQFKYLLNSKVHQLQDLVKPSKNYRNVLCHGDLWLNNLLYKYDEDGNPEDCCIVDYQLLRYVPPAHDIYFYLFINTTSEFRQKYTEDLLQYYYEMLTEELKSANLDINDYYPWEIFIESGKDYKEASKIIAVMYKTVLLLGDEYWKLFANDMTFLNEFAFHNRSKYVLDWYKKNEIYRSKVIEMMLELQDSLINN